MSSSELPLRRIVVDEFIPTLNLVVSFYAKGGGGQQGIEEGKKVSVSQAILPPYLKLSSIGTEDPVNADSLFTVILSDPDAPSRADPKFGEFLHFLMVNCKASDLYGTGDVLTAYHGPSPGPGSGEHRYCFVVYAQPSGRIECDEAKIGTYSGFPPRRMFKQRAFAAKYGLNPVAAVSWITEHDDVQPYMAAKIQGLAPPE
jgi:hypothetical protein